MEKMRLLNTYVNNVTLDEAVEFLLQKIREQTPAYVVEVNVDVVVKMETDLVLRQITDNADLTLVDGQPLIWISKLYGRPLKMKVSGSDLVPTLLQAAAKEGRSVFVLGGKEDAARKAAENIKARYPGLVMAGALSPRDAAKGEARHPAGLFWLPQAGKMGQRTLPRLCIGRHALRRCHSGFSGRKYQARPEGVQREWTGMVLPLCEGAETAVPPLFCG